MGKLTLVTLPIGNLEDITLRALDFLKKTSIVLCEDTRSFKELLKKYSISYEGKTIISFHDHSSEEKLQSIIERYCEDEVCCVSEAGSPYLSDPAYPLLVKAIEAGYEVTSFPGVSAFTMALELSGLPAIPATFLGFFPRENKKKNEFVERISSQKGTYVFFEGVGKVEKTMQFLVEKFPKAQFSIAREMTKMYESAYRFRGNEYEEIKKEIVFKGEFTICLYHNNEGPLLGSGNLKELAQDIYQDGLNQKKLSQLLGEILGVSNKEIYNHLNTNKKKTK